MKTLFAALARLKAYVEHFDKDNNQLE